MLKNIISASNKFYEDQALIFLTFGGFGRYVLSLLHQEFERLGIPENKVSFLAFDTEKPHRDRVNLEHEADYFIHLDEFEGDVYIDNEENEQLKEAVKHIPTNLLRDIEGGCKGVPAVGFVSFHKYDDLVITREALRLIDDVRANNPGKKIKLIIISGMGGSVSNGMSIPFLYRIRNRLREKKIRVEVFLATSEGYLGLQNVQEDGVERNCVTSAMLWEYAIAGRNGLVYPGKNGMRDKKMFDGRIAHRVYIFSGGSAETSLKYQAIASTIAQSISTLETTKVGSYLDGDRVNYSAHILEREWAGKNGDTHPTGLLTMNVAGLKGDCLPQIFHLYTVKRFVEDLTKPLDRQEEEKIKGKAISAFLENDLNEDDILGLFKIDIPTLTPETINHEHVSEETIYEFLKDKIAEMHESAAKEFERKKKIEEVSLFVEKVINNFSQKGDEITLSPGDYLKGSLLFYEKLASLVDEKISNVAESITKVEKELFEGRNQKTLNDLLDKLATVTKKKNGIGGLVVKLGQSPTITLINQIIDTASSIQQQKREKYNHLLLQHIYNSLLKFLQDQQETLKNAVFKYNNMIAVMDREVDNIKRIGRSAFTYNKAKFDELTDYLMEKIYAELEVISTQEVIEQLGSPILRDKTLGEKACIEKLLKIIQPDLNQLTRLADDLFCAEQKVHEYVKTMFDQFFMTLRLDRDRFPTLETSQSRFVMCTKNFYEKYKDDLFEGYCHIETENPFNVIVTKHEEGFPFIAISYLHRINEEYKELRAYGKSSLGHIMADLDDKLPLLDA
ncbi:MAG: tubulin-like doman-containing protein [Pseudomonadota bacterium]